MKGKMGNILKRNKYFYQLIKSKIDFQVIDSETINKNIPLILKLGSFAWINHAGCFFDAEIEDLLVKYSKYLETFVDTEKISKDINHLFPVKTGCSTLHVATIIADSGGHTRVLKQVISISKEMNQCLVLTGMDTTNIPQWFRDETKEYADYISLNNFRVLFDRAYALRLLSKRFKRIIIYSHPFDVTPTLAFSTADNPPIATENHAHSWFWYGRSITDLIFCHSEYHTEFTRKYRRIANCIHVPVTQMSLSRNKRKIHSQRKI